MIFFIVCDDIYVRKCQIHITMNFVFQMNIIDEMHLTDMLW